MTYSAFYHAGTATTSDLLEANLSADIGIIGTSEYWNEKSNYATEGTITSEYAKTFFGQVIAFSGLGEIGLQWWEHHPNLEERLSWDQNVDGLPDEGAPSWLGPVNLEWKVPIESNYYQREYPLYMVRFWEDDFLRYIKEEILFYQEKGWNGIFFDTVPPGGWTETNELHSPIYSWEELAEYSYSGLKKIRDFIDSTSPDFKLFINSSALSQWMHYRPEVFNLLDGIVEENALFYDEKRTFGNEYPAHYELKHWNHIIGVFKDKLLVMEQQGVDIPVILTEYVDDSPEIAVASAISLNQLSELSNHLASHSVYDRLSRTKENPSKQNLALNYVAYVGGDGNDQILNTSNARSILVGGEGDDILIGSDLDDVLMGGNGNNMINGGDGFDIAVYDRPYEAFIISGDSIAQQVELKSQYRHQLEITLKSWTVPGKTPKFSLFVNGSLVENEMSITPGEEHTFRYWSATPIKSIQYLNTNGAYFPEYKSAVGTQIRQILVNDQQVALADAAFLDGKEEWAGYGDENGPLNPGYGNIYFDTASISSGHVGVNDELHSIERIMFSGESYSSRAADDYSDFFHIVDLEPYDGIIETVRGKGKLKGTRVADAFTFNSLESFTKKSADKIIGFNASHGDTIALSPIAFPSLQGVSAISFAKTKSKKELKQFSKMDYDFVYFEKRGRLYFDGNGAEKNWGNSSEGGLIAILKGNPVLTAEDITLLA